MCREQTYYRGMNKSHETYAESVVNNTTGNKRYTAMYGDVKSHKRQYCYHSAVTWGYIVVTLWEPAANVSIQQLSNTLEQMPRRGCVWK